VDGYRVDAIPHLFEPEIDGRPDDETHAPTHLNATYDMVVQWREIMDKYSGGDNGTKVLMVEAYGSLDQVMAYYGTPSAPGGHFAFNFWLITDVHYNPPTPSSAEDISRIINEYLDRMTDGRTPNWVLGNHDQHRVASRFPPALVDGMNFIGQLLPGISVTYNGEEIGMQNTIINLDQVVDPQGINAGACCYLEATRDLQRTPFQWNSSINAGFSTGEKTWLPVNRNYLWLNLEAQQFAQKSHYRVYYELTQLRKKPAFKQGETEVAALSERVFGFTRTLDGEDSYLVVVNFGTARETINVTQTFSNVTDYLDLQIVSINSRYSVGHIVEASNLEVGPLEAYVFTSGLLINFASRILPSSIFMFILYFVVRYL